MPKTSNCITAPIYIAVVFGILILCRVFLISGDFSAYIDTSFELPSVSGSFGQPEISETAVEMPYLYYNGMERAADKFFIAAFIMYVSAYLLPSVFYVRLDGKIRLKKYGFTIPWPRFIPFAVFLFLALIFLTAALNGVSYYVFGVPQSFPDILIPDDDANPASQGIKIFIIFCILPAICKESVFRSVIAEKYRIFGIFSTAVVSSAMFAMSHFSFSTFIVYFCAGMAFYTAFKFTRSVYIPMIMHTLYNTYIIFIHRYINNVFSIEQNRYILTFICIVLFILSSALTVGAAERIYYTKAYNNEPLPVKIKGSQGFIFGAIRVLFSPTFILLAVMFAVFSRIVR